MRTLGNSANALSKVAAVGSVAYGALVRSVLQASVLPEPAENAQPTLSRWRSNNLAPKCDSIGYRLETSPPHLELPIYEDEEMRPAVVKWCDTINLNADQLAKGTDQRKTSPIKDAAIQALKDILGKGPVRSNEAMDQAMLATGASKGTIQTATKDLDVQKIPCYLKNGGVDYWSWELPKKLKVNNSEDKK